MTNPPRWLAIALFPLVVSCQSQSGPRSQADRQANRQAVADCRAQADRTYAAQNRGDLSRREDKDDPFASSYNPGLVTRGLSAQYARDNLVQDCLNASSQPSTVVSPGEGTAFSPAKN